MNANEIAVRCQALHKEFGDGDSRIEVLRGVDLKVYLGEMSFLMGPSGSGKTTLLSVIAGLLDKTHGEIEVLGQRFEQLSSQERIRFRRDNLGFIFQQYHLLPALSAAENAAVPLLAARVPRAAALAKAKRLLEELGEQPTRLRILRGESPLTVSCPKRTVSISTARGGNKPR